MGAAESYAHTDPERLSEEGNLPLPEVLTHDVILAQHRFSFPRRDTLVSPYCVVGSVPDPLNPALTDHYVAAAVRTKCDSTASAGNRPPVNLVVVLDVSGSMNAHISTSVPDRQCSRLDAVKKAIIGRQGLLDRLGPHDRVGVICFNAETKVIQEVVSVANILRDRVATMVQKQEAVGGTNLAHALLVASRLLTHILAHDTNVNADGYVPPPSLLETGIDTAPRESPLANIGQVSVDVEMASTRPTENRILVITDEYLNASDDHQESFRVMQRIADESNIHTTFVAVGTGYSPGVTKKIRSIPGCSSSSVHSVEELEQRVLHDFDKTCFPVAYDVSIEVDSPTLNVLEPFGSAQGKFLIKEKTLFAGSGDDSVSCCLGVFRLKEALPPGSTLQYTTSFKDEYGVVHAEISEIAVTDSSDNANFRRLVSLCRLATLLRVFLTDEHTGCAAEPSITTTSGVISLPLSLRDNATPPCSPSAIALDVEGDDDLFPEDPTTATPASPGSPYTTPIPQGKVSAHYREILTLFAAYLQKEAAGDNVDPQLQSWVTFLTGITDHIADERVETASEEYITTPLITSKSDADSVFTAVNEATFNGALRDHHRRVVHKVYDAKMYSVLRNITSKVISEHDTWLLVNDAHLKAVELAAKRTFKDVESDTAWTLWKERWGALLEATLKATLHGRIFDVAKEVYATLQAGGSVQAKPLEDAVMAALETRSTEMSTPQHRREVASFVSRWILPPLLQHNGSCVWSYETGVPVREGETPEETPQCPTQ